MKNIPLLLVAVGCLIGLPLAAQKRVPQSFVHRGNGLKEGQLNRLTEVTQPGSSFLRLYFKGTQLGENSYLLLEAPDGATQKLRQPDLQNWRFSSAYFNGSSVKVSLFAAPGEKNVVSLSEALVTDEQAVRNRAARQAVGTLGSPPQPAASTPINLTETHPYAKAVGRFTDGTDVGGIGWIAPNGAIVTSGDLEVSSVDKDIIEFNVPPSVGSTVIHPAPEDQYPVQFHAGRSYGSYDVFIKGDGNLSPDLCSWTFYEALPNATGLRPGERQQAYFRIAANPSNWFIDAKEDADQTIPVDLFHYRALLTQTALLKQNSYLGISTQGDRDWYIVYNMPYFNQTAEGAPVTYQGSNVAIGTHCGIGGENLPGFGLGFAAPDFRNGLARFFSNNSVYVDPEGGYDPGTGEIHKPYRTENKAASDAPAGAQVYFARGEYYGPSTFTRPMTLRAPVGKVTLGVPLSQVRKAAGPTIPSELLAEGPSPSFERESAEDHRAVASPNPFRDKVTIRYDVSRKGPVSVVVFNGGGAEVARLASGEAEAGPHTVRWGGTDRTGAPVAPGLYVVRVNTGSQTLTTKVLKQ